MQPARHNLTAVVRFSRPAQGGEQAVADRLTEGAEGVCTRALLQMPLLPAAFCVRVTVYKAGEAALAQVALSGQRHGVAAVQAATRSHLTCTGRHGTAAVTLCPAVCSVLVAGVAEGLAARSRLCFFLRFFSLSKACFLLFSVESEFLRV